MRADPSIDATRAFAHDPGTRRGMLHRDESRLELLDLPDIDQAALRGNLRDIRIVNRLGGGTAVVTRYLPWLLDRVPEGDPVTLLDLATGSGDVPRVVADKLRRAGRPFAFTVLDASPQILREATQQLARTPHVTYAVGDARDTPFPDRAFDIVLCSLALHHFSPIDARRVLQEMERLSRIGFIVNDIRRCLSGFVAAFVASRVASRNPLTRHDMPLSVRRAYTPAELRALLGAAGIDGTTINTHPLFRMVAVRVKDPA